MFDVFYSGSKPGLFAFEQEATSLDDAAQRSRTAHYWFIYGDNDYTGFDFDYVPVPWETSHLHVWPTQWNQFGGAYLANKHTVQNKEYHFHTTPVPAKPTTDNWATLYSLDTFDYSWCPHPMDPPYIYVFGNQWYGPEQMPTVEYHTPGATERKYLHEPRATLAERHDNHWHTLEHCTWNYSWVPDPGDPPYIYVFGNQWHDATVMPTVEYHVTGATERKYMEYPRAELVEDKTLWSIPEEIDQSNVDFTWVPDPGSPPYIYHFGSDYQISTGLMYTVPGATEPRFEGAPPRIDRNKNVIEILDIFFVDRGNDQATARYELLKNKYGTSVVKVRYANSIMDTVTRCANRTRTNKFWVISSEYDYKNFDFAWHAEPWQTYMTHVFPSQHQKWSDTFLINKWEFERHSRWAKNLTEFPNLNFVADQQVDKPDSLFDIYYVDKGNDTAITRYEVLKGKYGNRISKVRYANNMMNTVARCASKATTDKFWVISSEYDYKNFDFAWHAEPWQNTMTHVFPSQHQKWSDTFLIDKHEFDQQATWATELQQFSNLNFVTDQQVVKPDNLFNIYYVDHGNVTSRHQYEFLRTTNPDMVLTRFVDNYLDTFKRIVATATTEYVWIINSVCDYTQFDFTWQPEPWQREMIHVFPSNGNSRGDTFYIHVDSFKKQMVELDLLDWFNVINYCEDQSVEWFPIPKHYYNTDDLVTEIKNYKFDFPYALFTNQKDCGMHRAITLWSKKDRVVERLTQSGATVLVPRDIKADLKTQIYDYPYISDAKPVINDYFGDRVVGGLDIVYISNGEPDEERWYDHLCYQSNHQAKWVRGINGRTAAYQEAARQSSTPWFFAVFAKLEVLGNDFPWYEWTPDYFQEPKHYIFNARNPVNGLEYGHQGMIAYNKRLVLENTTPGIDFTLSQPHESVPILSGVAHYNQTSWMTWRTAFREVVKLKHFMATEPTIETEHRLRVWCNEKYLIEGAEHAEWSVRGAKDAVAYYNEVDGDYEKLKLTFEWAWLEQRFNASNR